MHRYLSQECSEIPNWLKFGISSLITVSMLGDRCHTRSLNVFTLNISVFHPTLIFTDTRKRKSRNSVWFWNTSPWHTASLNLQIKIRYSFKNNSVRVLIFIAKTKLDKAYLEHIRTVVFPEISHAN